MNSEKNSVVDEYKNFNLLEEKIGYKFKNKQLLITAFSHSSYAFDRNLQSYEKMEFLGDSLLGTIVATYIYKKFDLVEGEMSKLRAKLVNAEALATVMKENGIDQFILKGKSLKQLSNSIISDVFESFVCAIYLDNGFNNALKFVKKFLLVNKRNVQECIDTVKDYKSLLQEKLHAISVRQKPQYILLRKMGKSHKLSFEMQLKIGNKIYATAVGKTKKNVEQQLAEIAIDKL